MLFIWHNYLNLLCSRFEHGHVQHADVSADDFSDVPPLLDDVGIISAQPVDCLDYQQVAGAQAFYQAVAGRSKVLPLQWSV